MTTCGVLAQCTHRATIIYSVFLGLPQECVDLSAWILSSYSLPFQLILYARLILINWPSKQSSAPNPSVWTDSEKCFSITVTSAYLMSSKAFLGGLRTQASLGSVIFQF